ncbi:HMG box-containing protein 1 [Anabrus simplex]|uniref:HMG box-containing protein 1 n=1 Tax=Anabrus simplex TaxID=316456 RepID=UPI0035A36CE9
MQSFTGTQQTAASGSEMMEGPILTYQQQEEDCQPKDLSLKSVKKMKPIPPPLNLGVPSSTLKEFAIIATSPRSPLMQKNLPFRKRAYSFSSGTNDNTQQTSVVRQNVPSTASAVIETPEDHSSSLEESSLESSFSPTSSPSQISSQSCPISSPHLVNNSTTRSHLNPMISTPSEVVPLCESPGIRSHYPNSPCWSPTLGPLSPSHWMSTSVLLSPAPSSLGSSREELNTGGDITRLNNSSTSNIYPWPPPAWHCFQPGTLLKVDTPKGGTGGVWRLAEELSLTKLSPDLVGPLRVEQIEHLERGVLRMCLSCVGHMVQNSWEGDVVAQCHFLHTFYVKDKGWCAVYPDEVGKQYGASCRLLERGDICLSPPKFPMLSPDICDRFKRFSFPPEEVTLPSPMPSPSATAAPSHTDSILSPPSSPCKKPRDPDRPKRPMNAFMLFAKRYRLELIQMHPGKDNRAISVILGEAWRKLPPSDKEVYVSEARTMAQEQKRLYPDCWKRKRSHSTS